MAQIRRCADSPRAKKQAENEKQMKLNYKRTILVGFAFFLISAFWQAYDAIVPLILTNHFGLPQTISGVIMSVDNVLAVFMLPIFGALSDKIMTRFGKRTPFVVLGTVAAVLSFILLTVVNGIQIDALRESGIIESYEMAAKVHAAALERLDTSFDAGVITEAARAAGIAEADAALDAVKEALRADALELTLSNIWPLIGFIGVLLIVLIAMATYRSPAVALMPDVTVKPLRSKGNAIINLMGTAGGIIVLVFSSIFGISDNPYMSYTAYVVATCIVMLVGLAVFILTVKERKWADEADAITRELGLEEAAPTDGNTGERTLDKAEFKSLILILASVVVGISAFFTVRLLREEGSAVRVQVNGETVAEYSLLYDGEYVLNGGSNILVIEDGRAFMKDADCPDHLCVKQGKISKTGQVITCLPNKLTVTVYGEEKLDVDFIS
jgi:nitrate/nitrite transporter NarK